MPYIGADVEYALHFLLGIGVPEEQPRSSGGFAQLQSIPSTSPAGILQKLENAGIVVATGGMQGAYRLARAPQTISVRDVIEALGERKALFERRPAGMRCASIEAVQPARGARDAAAIHEVMQRAERALWDELSRATLASLSAGFLSRPHRRGRT
jgi:Rrf2 family protein